MKILIVTQYFWPEEFRVNDIAKYFSEKGHQVDVVTGVPNYPSAKIFEDYKKNIEKYNKFFGVNIIRLPIILRGDASPLRLFLNYLSFVLSGIFIGTYKIRNKKYDIVFTFATSPITVALPAIFFSFIKNCKHILWVLDIWPDILSELKIIKKKFIIIILRKIVGFIYKKADIILVQSKGFKEIIHNQLNDNRKIHYYPAWSEDLDAQVKTLHEFNEYKNKFNIVFTGNIGEAQNFENIITAAEIIKDEKNIQWLIVGTGRKVNQYSDLIKKKGIENFVFLGNKLISEIKSFHNLANVLFVSLASGKFLSTTIPGKFQTYLRSNKFILGFIDGETARLIKESKTGVVVNPSNARELANTIVYLKNNPQKVKEVTLKNYGIEYLNNNFNKELLLLELEKHIHENIDYLKIINSVSHVPFNKNFSLSGLNLAYLGYSIKKTIHRNKDTYLWPDGIFFKRFFSSDEIKKIPGRKIVSDLKIPSNIKKIYVFGNLDNSSRTYLETIYKMKITNIALPFDEVDNLYNKYCNMKFLDTDLIFLTLPTPKQEQFASLIMANNKFYKIICIGGAVNMASGSEKIVPPIIEKFNLEFLWRLRTDSVRRLKRLMISALYYFIGEISLKFKNLNIKLIDGK